MRKKMNRKMTKPSAAAVDVQRLPYTEVGAAEVVPLLQLLDGDSVT